MPEKELAVLALALSVAACGFHPLYANRGTGSQLMAGLQSVSVQTSGNALEQATAFALEDLLKTRGKTGRYQLGLETRVQISDIAIEQTSDVTRQNIRLTSRFALYDSTLGKDVLVSTSVATTAFNRTAPGLANLAARKSAEDRLVRKIARDIYTRLSLFFEHQQNPESP